jgi:hypothetical protein
VINGKHSPRQLHGALMTVPVALRFFLKTSHGIKPPPCVGVADTREVEIRSRRFGPIWISLYRHFRLRRPGLTHALSPDSCNKPGLPFPVSVVSALR